MNHERAPSAVAIIDTADEATRWPAATALGTALPPVDNASQPGPGADEMSDSGWQCGWNNHNASVLTG